MDFTEIFIKVYGKVLETEKNKFSVNDDRIRNAIQNIHETYLPNRMWEMKYGASNANYNDAAYRCAYLHKYAACYTGMVYQLLLDAFKNNINLHAMINSKQRLNLCSLGGGPGTEIVGTLTALYMSFQFIQCQATILDLAGDWEKTFTLILQEISSGGCGGLTEMVSGANFNYVQADLLRDIASNTSVRGIVGAADLVTMVKFISAAACEDTMRMVQDIFTCMKPGALVLFIDNAAGGFYERMQNVATQCGMDPACNPLLHHDYQDSRFENHRFGFRSQSHSKIAFQIWKKPDPNPYNMTQQLRNDYSGRVAVAQAQAGEWEPQSAIRIKIEDDEYVNDQTSREQGTSGGCCSII